jgi:hypothetical protein
MGVALGSAPSLLLLIGESAGMLLVEELCLYTHRVRNRCSSRARTAVAGVASDIILMGMTTE